MNPGKDENKCDNPPYSRLFIVCSKDLVPDDLRGPFEEYGDVEDIYMPRDRNTGEFRGVAYIKYAKTSSAAAAIKNLHQKPLKNKSIKVMIAVNKNDNNENVDAEQYNRLFIKVLKTVSNNDIEEYFSKFGQVESVFILKDRSTNESKGLAYVQFKTFLDAAKAFEKCDQKYKAVFAVPKQELKRGREGPNYNDSFRSSNSSHHRDYYNDFYRRDDMPFSIQPRVESFPRENIPYPRENMLHLKDSIAPLIRTPPQNYKTVFVTCNREISPIYIEKLFNIVPGMIEFTCSADPYNGYPNAIVTYEDERAAAYAVERLNDYEFPSGARLCVKPEDPLAKVANNLSSIVNSFKNAVDASFKNAVDVGSTDLSQLADAIAQASSLIKAATSGKGEPKQDQDPSYCSVRLPPPQPIADTSKIAQRCFIVFKPHPPPAHVLKDVFCRFGDLIDIATFPNKTFGFAKYASTAAAQEAINTLHGAIVCGITLKVLEADERPPKDDSNTSTDTDMLEITDRKRMRLDDREDI